MFYDKNNSYFRGDDKMIKIVKNIEDAGFVTHAGKFHADEVFATILLEKIYDEINLIRLPEVDGINLDKKFVYDIGGGKFDHHQIGGNGQRNSGIKYAAFGLVWKEFGRAYLQKKQVNNIEEYNKVIIGFPVWWYRGGESANGLGAEVPEYIYLCRQV